MPIIFPSPGELHVDRLGECHYASPLPLTARAGRDAACFLADDARVALDIECSERKASPLLFVERAGPRERLHFDATSVRAAIVTCGGLCPGINNAVRAIVLELHHRYRVPEIVGFRYGYEGLDPQSQIEPLKLGPEEVRTIHKAGGSVLGVSRGTSPPAGAKMIAASSGGGGSSSEPPAQTEPSRSANAWLPTSPGRVNANTDRPCDLASCVRMCAAAPKPYNPKCLAAPAITSERKDQPGTKQRSDRHVAACLAQWKRKPRIDVRRGRKPPSRV
jgi:hypothetical protein